jgi:hypothetical protein
MPGRAPGMTREWRLVSSAGLGGEVWFWIDLSRHANACITHDAPRNDGVARTIGGLRGRA